MAEHLDMRQRNNLAVGNELAVELAVEVAVTGSTRRAFVVIWPYYEQVRGRVRFVESLIEGDTFSKVLNADREDEGDVRYGCKVVEVEREELARYPEAASFSDYTSLDRRTLAITRGLKTLDELEAKLRQHVEDLASLVVAWRVLPWQPSHAAFENP